VNKYSPKHSRIISGQSSKPLLGWATWFETAAVEGGVVSGTCGGPLQRLMLRVRGLFDQSRPQLPNPVPGLCPTTLESECSRMWSGKSGASSPGDSSFEVSAEVWGQSLLGARRNNFRTRAVNKYCPKRYRILSVGKAVSHQNHSAFFGWATWFEEAVVERKGLGRFRTLNKSWFGAPLCRLIGLDGGRGASWASPVGSS
jgi:hypothetical protein